MNINAKERNKKLYLNPDISSLKIFKISASGVYIRNGRQREKSKRSWGGAYKTLQDTTKKEKEEEKKKKKEILTVV